MVLNVESPDSAKELSNLFSVKSSYIYNIDDSSRSTNEVQQIIKKYKVDIIIITNNDLEIYSNYSVYQINKTQYWEVLTDENK